MEQQNANIIAAIDVGTTKIVVLVGRKDENGTIEVIGYGRTESKGMRRGAVLNIEETSRSIKVAVAQAEETSGIKITEAYVGIAGQHIRSQRCTQTKNRNLQTEAISQADIDFLMNQMREVPKEMGEEILHILPQSYTVDGEHDIQSPVGMCGKQLSCDFHIVFGQTAAANNLRTCVEKNGIKVKALILEPLASSSAVLTNDDKELGVALVDIGGGTTDLAIFRDGRIFHTEVIPYGGNTVTNDIRQGCNILERLAEGLKVQYGSAVATADLANKSVTIPGTGGLKPKDITLINLAKIINARMVEIIRTVKLHFDVSGAEVDASGATKKLGAGIVITGGGSMLRGLRQLFENCMGYETRIGVPNRLIKSNFESVTNMPSNSTSIGLLIMGFEDNMNDGVREQPQIEVVDNKVEESADAQEQPTAEVENEKPKKGKMREKVSILGKAAFEWFTTVDDKEL